MYKANKEHNKSFPEFCAVSGISEPPEDEWVRLTSIIPWNDVERLFAKNFPSHTGHPAKSFRIALGSFILQNRLPHNKGKANSDRELVKRIAESPSLQYFLGLSKFQNKAPFTSPALVAFRRRLNSTILLEINNRFVKNRSSQIGADTPVLSSKEKDADYILSEEATVSQEFASGVNPVHTYRVLNEARKQLERMIDYCHTACKHGPKPRIYRRIAQEEFEKAIKEKNPTPDISKAIIRKQLSYLKRDLKVLQHYMANESDLKTRFDIRCQKINALYQQMKAIHSDNVIQTAKQKPSRSASFLRENIHAGKDEFCSIYRMHTDDEGYTTLTRELSFVPSHPSSALKEGVELIQSRAKKEYRPDLLIVETEDWTESTQWQCNVLGIDLSLKISDWTQAVAEKDIPCMDTNHILHLDTSDDSWYDCEVASIENEDLENYDENGLLGENEYIPCLVTRGTNGACPLDIAKLLLLKNLFHSKDDVPYSMVCAYYDKEYDKLWFLNGKWVLVRYNRWHHSILRISDTFWWITLRNKFNPEISLFPEN